MRAKDKRYHPNRRTAYSITYTSSGFPQKITFSDGSTIMYAYTADGARLRSKHSGGGITRDRCGEAMYEGGVRKMIMHEEGYIDCSASNAMRFYVKDHLGSVRAVLNSSGTVLESCDYYPLGGQFNASSGQVQPYKFSGKELDTYKNINTLDFGARTYDPSIGRWLTQDPMAENYYNLSPYNYCAGNPVRYVDPDGKDWFQNTKTGEIYYDSEITLLNKDSGYMKGNKDWQYLAKNNEFSIPDKTLLDNYARPLFSGGYLFDKDSAEKAMSDIGYALKPLEAIIQVTEITESHSEGTSAVTLNRREEKILKIDSSVYVNKDTFPIIRHCEHISSQTTKVNMFTNTYTSVRQERVLYSYGTEGEKVTLPLKEMFLEIAKTIAEIL